MSGRGRGAVRLAIQGFDSHPPHETAHVAAACFLTLLAEQVAQHATAREQIIHMQFVNASHQHQVRVRNRARTVVDRGAADRQLFRLPGN